MEIMNKEVILVKVTDVHSILIKNVDNDHSIIEFSKQDGEKLSPEILVWTPTNHKHDYPVVIVREDK